MGTSSCFLGKDVPGLQNLGVYFPAAINCILQTGSGFTQVRVYGFWDNVNSCVRKIECKFSAQTKTHLIS